VKPKTEITATTRILTITGLFLLIVLLFILTSLDVASEPTP